MTQLSFPSASRADVAVLIHMSDRDTAATIQTFHTCAKDLEEGLKAEKLWELPYRLE